MNMVHRLARLLLTLALTAAVAAGVWWLLTHPPASPPVAKPAPAASVPKPVKEEDLNRVTLTDEAFQRLGIQLGTVERRSLSRVRAFGGEVLVPLGQTVLVCAPLGGVLKSPSQGMPRPGQNVKKDQPVVELLPLLSPEGRTTLASSLVEASGQVSNAQTQVDAAKIALDRANRLLRDGAGSRRNVDETQAAYDLATKTLEAATARRKLLTVVAGEVEHGTAAPISITAPEDGLLRALSALPGQTVPAGASLFEIIDLSTIWIRVAVPVGDLGELARQEPASVSSLAARIGDPRHPARPVVAPPSAHAPSATIDLYYELANPETAWIPGQRVSVLVPFREAREVRTVPWSAILYDLHGGTWVYEQRDPRVFVRRRVAVQYTSGATAVLAQGPPEGTRIVVQGSQELFGAESGFSK